MRYKKIHIKLLHTPAWIVSDRILKQCASRTNMITSGPHMVYIFRDTVPLNQFNFWFPNWQDCNL